MLKGVADVHVRRQHGQLVVQLRGKTSRGQSVIKGTILGLGSELTAKNLKAQLPELLSQQILDI